VDHSRSELAAAPEEPSAMNKQNWIITTVTLAVLAAAPRHAAAQQKSGKDVFDSYVTWRFINTLDMSKAGNAKLAEGDGFSKVVEGTSPCAAQRSDCTGISTFRCIAVFQQIGDRFSDTGSCVSTDQDGDHIYSTFVDANSLYRGGTGKYTGLTGTFDGAVIWGTHGGGGDHVERVIRHRAQWEIK
jgi:hypothetical protein